MNQSLREEIKEATRMLLYHPPYPQEWNDGVDKHADLILSKIEKRIDERIEYLKNRKPIMGNFKIDELEKFKEMLK